MSVIIGKRCKSDIHPYTKPQANISIKTIIQIKKMFFYRTIAIFWKYYKFDKGIGTRIGYSDCEQGV